MDQLPCVNKEDLRCTSVPDSATIVPVNVLRRTVQCTRLKKLASNSSEKVSPSFHSSVNSSYSTNTAPSTFWLYTCNISIKFLWYTKHEWQNLVDYLSGYKVVVDANIQGSMQYASNYNHLK